MVATVEALDVCGGLGEMVHEYCTRLARAQLGGRAAVVGALRTPKDVARRQDHIRSTILKSIGGLPAERTPLEARVTGVLERDGYRVEKVIYQSQPRCHVTANCYVPSTGPGPFPAVLVAMGHYEEGKACEDGQRLFISLARRGFVVLAYDPPDEGERREYLDPATGRPLIATCPEAHTMSGLQCLLTGRNMAHYELWDGIRGVDYLSERPDVDPTCIGVTGHSGGGTQTSYLAVLEPRLAVAVPCCYMTSWERLWAELGPQDAEQNFPGFLADGLDFPDFATAFAPKPFLVLSAERDFFPIEGARRTFEEISRVYSILGKPERTAMAVFDTDHSWSVRHREATCAWLERWLMGRAPSEPEGEARIEAFEALNCTPTGHTRTSFDETSVRERNAAAAETLRPLRTAASLGNPRGLPPVIARRLGVALPVPPPRFRPTGALQRDGCRIEKIVIESEPGIVVPALVFTPAGGPGRRPAIITVSDAGKAGGAAPGGLFERLARGGRVVVAADLRGLGESRTRRAPVVYSDLYDPDMRAIVVGRTMAGMQVHDLLQVIAYATARPDVDGGRLMLHGAGTAGVIALLAAALVPGSPGVVVDRAILSYRDIVRSDLHTGIMDLVVPGILLDFDLPDVAHCVGLSRISIVEPMMPDGSAASAEHARLTYGPQVRIRVGAGGAEAELTAGTGA
jgi:dienelactone hydrolase